MTAHLIDGSVIRQNVCQPDAPSVRGGLLLLVADLAQRRDHLARDERQRDEDRREHDRRHGEEDLDAVLGQEAEPAVGAVEQDEREADDDRRERERQVDERVDDALAAEVPCARSRARRRSRRPC